MNRRGPRARSVAGHAVVAGVLLAALALLVACPRRTGEVAPRDLRTYTVHGRVTMLPEAGKPLSDFMVHHEAIPDFVRQDGTLGMGEMTMRFSLGKGVSLEGISVGDAVTMQFHVSWRPSPKSWISGVERLPEGTPLFLSGYDPGSS